MPKFKVSVQCSILSLLTLLVLLSSGMVGIVSYLGSKQSIRFSIATIMREISGRVVEKTENYLNAAVRTSKLNARLIQTNLIDANNSEELIQYFRGVMSANEQFVMLTYGETSGNFLMLKRMPDNTYSIKTTIRQGEKAVSTWQHENPMWAKVYPERVVEPTESAFDPRERPWYQQAIAQKGFIWTKVYLFYSDRKPGISGSTPIYDASGTLKGVMGVDITIDELSYFLGKLKIGDRGKAFIFNPENQIVALPLTQGEDLFAEMLKPENRQSETQSDILSVSEVSDPAIAVSFQAFQQQFPTVTTQSINEPIYFSFVLDGSRYLGMYAPFTSDSGFAWRIGIVVPERDFMAQAIKNNLIIFALSSGLAIAAVIIGIILSRKIAEPLVLLAAEAEKIKQLKLNLDIKIESSLIEVEAMGQSFYNMTIGLRSFKKYVPASLVRQLIVQQKEAFLGGERRELTIYFSDIANFTTIAESLEPEKLVEGLSEYLSEMSYIIHQNQGTVDKYIGDSIMAFWGAPAYLKNHAILACQTALASQRQLAELAINWEKSGKIVFQDRIGIATGEVIVGNMGAEDRLNYTAVGDSVNLASRLEGLNKYYGTKILISDATYQKARDYIEVRLLDFVAVKGKTKPVAVYELIAEKENISAYTKDFILRFSEGVKLYREREWSKALKIFEEAQRMEPSDKASEIFINRCLVYQKNPPDDEWTGVFVWRSLPSTWGS